MANTTIKLMMTAALLATAACSKKKLADYPPPPPTSSTPDANSGYPAGGDGSGVGRTGLPGSRADFVAQAGSDTVLFATDTYSIDQEAAAILQRQVQWLRRYPSTPITVEGHCDERGTREYNLALGERRANAAKDYLVNQGIPASRISIISYGKERPASDGSDEGSWAQNRRAVTVVPVG